MPIATLYVAALKIPDFVNGVFELIGGLFVFANCVRLYKDKEVKGVVWQLTIFFAAWGFWNLYYYPFLHQWMSFVGGLLMTIGNTLWIVEVIWYLKHPPKKVPRHV
jgi:hypothetical protein